MPNLEKSCTPAKNFQQIWQELDKRQQIDLRRALCIELSISTVTVYNWYKGKPMINEATRKAVVRIVKRVTGIESDYRTIC